MRKLTLTIALIIAASVGVSAQAVFRIQNRCAAPNQRLYGSITATSTGTFHNPCPIGGNVFAGDVDMAESDVMVRTLLVGTDFTPFWPGANPLKLVKVGYGTRQALTAGGGFTGMELNFPLNLNGTSGIYQGQSTSLNLQGAFTGGAIRAQSIDIFSNGATPTGSTELVGTDVNVDVGGAFARVYGGRFSAVAGNASSAGAEFYGVQGTALAIHHGGATIAYGGDFWVSSSAGAPATLTLGAAVNAGVRIRSGANFASISGLRVAGWQLIGTAENSYGVYIDSTVDVGTTSRYALYSLSTSPSLFSGVVRSTQDVYITDSAKGIVLKSPDGTCYRYTAANGGALNAGAAIGCP